MSRYSKDGKPFYVDVGTSMVAVRCASNHDVIVEYDYARCPQIIKIAKDMCDRMNKEVEIYKPRRNCDVGTAEEQAKRFYDFCDGYMHKTGYESCGTCPLWTSGAVGDDCELKWAQMPYEEGGAK